MAEQWEQYEIWVLNYKPRHQWELVATFRDFDVASAVFRNRSYRQKLVHATYQGAKLIGSEVLAEIGRTREEP